MGIVCVIFGYSFLKSTSLFDDDITLYAVYKDVGGLQTGTAVSINGKNVGTVNSVRFKDTEGNLLVTFTVNRDLAFSRNSTVELYDTGLIGGKGLRINPFAKLSDSLNKAGLGRTLANLESTVANLNRLMARIESGDGSLGKLSMFLFLVKSKKTTRFLRKTQQRKSRNSKWNISPILYSR